MGLKNILVTGATGHQGGALITALLSQTPQQFKIFALTRNASSKSAQNLISKGVTVIQGDTTAPSAIFTEIPNPYGVFLVTLPTATERAQATPLIDIAAKVGVEHFIFTSADRGGPVRSEDDNCLTPIPHFEVKRGIEKHLKSVCENGGMSWTILRPTSFMDNLSPGFVGKALATMLKQMGPTRLSLIATRDIGRVAALVFGKPELYKDRALTLTGDLLTFEEMNEIFREETGSKMPRMWELLVDGLQWAMADLGASMRYFREGGYDYDLDAGLKEELGLKGFRRWLREDSWFEILRKG